jgi:glycolate oxidase FAD binding subunit
MTDKDLTQSLAEKVRDAAAQKSPLAIRGSGSKRFLTGEIEGTSLDVTAHRGIVSYEPTELVITARAGTPLTEIEAVLAEKNQMLGFEPPHFGVGATLGGTVACGFSGPRRPYAGSARDFVLGVRIINGRGEILRFGGQVMKNVAGFDVSRLMAGNLGTLGVMLEVSLKVLPRPAAEATLAFDTDAATAIDSMNAWTGRPLPLSAAAHVGDILYIRLSGTESGVRAARAVLGGDLVEKGPTFWEELREHRRAFFETDRPLWRLSVPPATPPLDLPGKWLIDWGGAQRWLGSEAPAERICREAARIGGHAMRFRPLATPPLAAALQALHHRLRAAFDPAGIFNPSLMAVLPARVA